MSLVQLLFNLFTQHMTYKEYYPILISCKYLYKWERFMHTYISTMNININIVIKNNNLDLLKWLSYYFPIYNIDSIIFKAVQYGHLNIIRWAYSKGYSYNSSSIKKAISYEYIDIIKWLISNQPIKDITFMIVTAARNGYINILRYLYSIGIDDNCYGAISIAAKNGHLEIVQFLYRHNKRCSQYVWTKIAENGHLEILQFLQQYQPQLEGCTPHAMNYAAAAGNLNIVQWLHENRPEGCTSQAMRGAALHGHLSVVKYLRENRNEGEIQRSMSDAASKGHLSVVKYLYNFTKIISPYMCKIASNGGHFNIIAWAQSIKNE